MQIKNIKLFLKKSSYKRNIINKKNYKIYVKILNYTNKNNGYAKEPQHAYLPFYSRRNVDCSTECAHLRT